MKGNLLDTSVALIALTAPDALPGAVRDAVLAGPNVLSVMSYWEVVIKAAKGRLEVGDPREWWREALGQLAAAPLAWRPVHVAELYDLPAIHQDPFDRALIAQARVEELALVTTDGQVPLYASDRLRVICG